MMKPRSLVFTLFGDYLRYCGDGEVALSAMTDLLALFGTEPTTTRVVMSRLRQEGWFETRRSGRQTRYLLSERGWELLDAGRERIFRHELSRWAGVWTMAVYRIPDGDRTVRDRLRKELAWLGCGQLQQSTWLCPGDRLQAVRELLDSEPEADGQVFLSRSGDLARDRELAFRCWDLSSLDDEYAQFVKQHAPLAFLDLTAQDAFLRRTELTDSYRHFPFRDPELPEELLPRGWHGWAAHELFVAAHTALKPEAESFIEGVVKMPVERSHEVTLQGRRVSFLRPDA